MRKYTDLLKAQGGQAANTIFASKVAVGVHLAITDMKKLYDNEQQRKIFAHEN